MTEPSGAASAVKAGSAWAGVGVVKALALVGIHGWSDAAAVAATLYTLLLIAEWVWKKWKGRK